MLAKTNASTVQGVEATTITVEVNTGGKPPEGKPHYQLVGLPDNAVKEGFSRIESAIRNNNLPFVRVFMVVNLAPADIRKEGSAYDLPIAVGILAATGQIVNAQLDKFVIMGELALDGQLRPIKGALPIAIQARKEKFAGLILPKQNAREAAIVNDLPVYGVSNLRQVVDFLNGSLTLHPEIHNTRDFF